MDVDHQVVAKSPSNDDAKTSSGTEQSDSSRLLRDFKIARFIIVAGKFPIVMVTWFWSGQEFSFQPKHTSFE